MQKVYILAVRVEYQLIPSVKYIPKLNLQYNNMDGLRISLSCKLKVDCKFNGKVVEGFGKISV